MIGSFVVSPHLLHSGGTDFTSPAGKGRRFGGPRRLARTSASPPPPLFPHSPTEEGAVAPKLPAGIGKHRRGYQGVWGFSSNGGRRGGKRALASGLDSSFSSLVINVWTADHPGTKYRPSPGKPALFGVVFPASPTFTDSFSLRPLFCSPCPSVT